MVKRNYLTVDEADATYAQPVQLATDPDLRTRLAPHFLAYVNDLLREPLGTRSLGRAGLHITTTLDWPMQQLAQQVISKNVTALRGYNLSNAALVALKPGNAELLVMVGSADYNNQAISGEVNVAVSLRQPGSAIKPLLYATAFDDALISPTTVLWDLPTKYQLDALQTYLPVNYDGKYHGPVTARAALANSYNVPAVKLLDRVGIERMRQKERHVKQTRWYSSFRIAPRTAIRVPDRVKNAPQWCCQ